MWRNLKTGRPSRFIGELNSELYRKSSVNFIPKEHTDEKKGKTKESGFVSAADLVSEEK